jgi:hypothetical protein
MGYSRDKMINDRYWDKMINDRYWVEDHRTFISFHGGLMKAPVFALMRDRSIACGGLLIWQISEI